ncbi:GntR family transcriptional regulator [Oceanicola granulosus]|uniref:GntR family transcriptional regulator n=1 Tax=Oceanicola granulosus TaxID=252302 RepID=UPI0003142C80|nr:GntR family transcriptional regulator [Oceanicola granulosus]
MNTQLAPRHLRLRELLLHRWKADGLQVGDRIESQNEIARFCDFSLITIVKTLKDLEADGIIRRQVGKGSFLVRAPWTEAHHRVGFFYNRDVVGGGIFDNDFYTRLVVALEKAVVSDGHEFILGSFTNAKMPMAVWEALDVVLLTSITGETRLDFLDTAATQVSVIDQTLVHPKVHSYRLDYDDAFREMFRSFDGPRKVLYLDSEIASNEQKRRRDAIVKAREECGPDCVLEVIKVNQEREPERTAPLLEALQAHAPDVVLGYMHRDWKALIRDHAPGVRIFSYGIDNAAPGFVVRSDEWMEDIVPKVYANLANRKARGAVHGFPARFEP